MLDDPRCWNDLAEENARLREENAALRLALAMFRECGCPICGGDCGSANPPIAFCPMRVATAAIGETHDQSPFDHTGAPR